MTQTGSGVVGFASHDSPGDHVIRPCLAGEVRDGEGNSITQAALFGGAVIG